MTRYLVQSAQNKPGYLEVVSTFDTRRHKRLIVQLPFWRPGRYEAARYNRQVFGVAAFSQDGLRPLPVHKTGYCTWEIDASGESYIDFWLLFKARQLDAGSSFSGPSLFYLNPINFLPFNTQRVDDPCEMIVRLPAHYKVASGANFTTLDRGDEQEVHILCPDFHYIVDQPLLASPDLESHTVTAGAMTISLHAWNAPNGLLEKLGHDVSLFALPQQALFGKNPVSHFHFLLLFPPYTHYHGVEHLHSTVCVLGPSADALEARYDDLLGLCSHELFHIWNVKSLRPADMMPYNYLHENYSRLGYMYEGATTLYGDVMLARGGNWSGSRLLEELNVLLKRHALQYGHVRMSLGDASVDTWVDGYDPIPHRRVSIYVEGALNIWLLDLHLRIESEGKFSFDDVLQQLYQREDILSGGYTEDDILFIMEDLVPESPWRARMQEYFHQPSSPLDTIAALLPHLGLEMKQTQEDDPIARTFGFKLSEKDEQGRCRVLDVIPRSPACTAGIHAGSSVSEVSHSEEGQLQLLLHEPHGPEVKMTLAGDGQHWYATYQLVAEETPSLEQQAAFLSWCGQKHPSA